METSTNLASVKPGPAESGSMPEIYLVQCSTRSSLGPALEAVRDSISKLSSLVSPHSCAKLYPERIKLLGVAGHMCGCACSSALLQDSSPVLASLLCMSCDRTAPLKGHLMPEDSGGM